jgi:hypothetical protein
MEYKIITDAKLIPLCFNRRRPINRKKITATPPVFESFLC